MSSKNQPSIKKNFIMNALLTMSSLIFPLITFPYVSRILLPEGTGRVSFATSLISYFNMIAQLGIPTYGVRACAQVRDDKVELSRTAHELLFINMVMTAISYISLAICLLFVPRLQDDRNLYIIVSFTIILTSIGMEWLYRGLEQYTYITKRSILFKFIALIAMFLLIHKKSDYVIYGGISIFAASASNVMNCINAHHYIYMHPIGNYHPMRHMKAVLVFFAMSVATTVYSNLDTVMLGFMTSDIDVGYYNAAIKIKNVLVSVVTSLGTVLLPRASYYVEHREMREFTSITNKALNFVILLATPLTLYFILFAKEGIYFLSGLAYAESVLPMQIIMPTVLFIGVSNILGLQILVPLGNERAVLFSEIAGAIIDLIINALLIPNFKSAGAAFGTLVAEFVVDLWQYRALKKRVKKVFKSIHYNYIILGLCFGTAASLWVKILGFGSFTTLLISAILFFGIYLGVLLFFKEPLVTSIINQLLDKIHKSDY